MGLRAGLDVLEKRNISCHHWDSHPRSQSLVTILTTLSQLRNLGDWEDIIVYQFSLEKHHNVPGDKDTESSCNIDF